MFYNTGIATYIWVLSNRKPADRQGKVQLIEACSMKGAVKRKNFSSPGRQIFFLTASPAVPVITDAGATDDHCQLSQSEQLCA